MKIKEIKIEEYQKTFISKVNFGQELHDIRKGWYIKIITDEVIGIGEAAPIPSISNECHSQAGYALDGFSLALKDINYDVSIEELLMLSDIHTNQSPSAKFAIQTAIYDVLSKVNNKSISAYINHNSEKKININSILHDNCTIDPIDAKVLKVKIHNHNIYDIHETIEKILKNYPSDIKLRIDFNGSLDLPKSIRIAHELEQYNVDYLEQPLPPQNLNDCYELRMNSSIPIAIDESLTDYFSAEKIIGESAADVLIIKPTLSGGYDDIDKIVGLCQQEKIRWIMTSSFETQVAQNSILHLIATYNTKEYCGLFNIKLFSDEVYPNIERSKYLITQNKG